MQSILALAVEVMPYDPVFLYVAQDVIYSNVLTRTQILRRGTCNSSVDFARSPGPFIVASPAFYIEHSQARRTLQV